MASDRSHRLSGADVATVIVLDAAIIAISVLIGWLLDRVAESAPLLELFGLVMGIAVAAVLTWSRLRAPSGSHSR